MKSLFLAAWLAVAAAAVVNAQYYTITCDSQNPGEQHVVGPVFAGNTPYIRASFTDNDAAVTMSNTWTAMTLSYRPDRTRTNGMSRIPGTWLTANECIFNISTQAYAHAGDYYFSISGTNGTLGRIQTFARGAMTIEYDPSTTTDDGILTTKVINWDQITHLGTEPWSVADTQFTNYLAGDTEIVVAGDPRSGSNTLSIASGIARDSEVVSATGAVYAAAQAAWQAEGYGTGDLMKAVADTLYDAIGYAANVSNAAWGAGWITETEADTLYDSIGSAAAASNGAVNVATGIVADLYLRKEGSSYVRLGAATSGRLAIDFAETNYVGSPVSIIGAHHITTAYPYELYMNLLQSMITGTNLYGARVRGLYAPVYFEGAGCGLDISAVEGAAVFGGTCNADELVGVAGYVEHYGSGVLSNAIPFNARVNLEGGGSILEATGYNVPADFAAGVGTKYAFRNLSTTAKTELAGHLEADGGLTASAITNAGGLLIGQSLTGNYGIVPADQLGYTLGYSDSVVLGPYAGHSPGGTNIGGSNVAIGNTAGYGGASTLGVFIGSGAGETGNKGRGTIAIGWGSSSGVSGGTNIFIGYRAGQTNAEINRTGCIAIGTLAMPSADFQAVLGGTTITQTVLRGKVECAGGINGTATNATHLDGHTYAEVIAAGGGGPTAPAGTTNQWPVWDGADWDWSAATGIEPTNRTITIPAGTPSGTIQTQYIDPVGRYIPSGTTVTWQFADGGYLMTNTLSWYGFYGGGFCVVQGNTGEANATALHTTQSVVLSNATDSVLYLYNNVCTFNLKNLNIYSPDVSYKAGVSINRFSCPVYVQYCYLRAAGKTQLSRNVVFGTCTYAELTSTYCSNADVGMYVSRTGCAYMKGSQSTGTGPNYGIASELVSTVGTNGVLTGTTANTFTSTGGIVR